MICVTNINVTPKTLQLKVGDKNFDLKAEVIPANATCKAVTWHSTKPGIVAVNQTSGAIRALAVGNARIYAKSVDGSNRTSSCTVMVAPTVKDSVDYHIIPYSTINLTNKKALEINMQTKNDTDGNGTPTLNKMLPLEHDESLQLSAFSYVNKQRWALKKNGELYKIYTKHGQDFILCKKNNDSKVYVSNNTSFESNISIIPYGSSANTFEIKLNQSNQSNLYLTVSGNDVIWSTYSSSNHINQVWVLEEKPANIHNGVDTVEALTSQTVNSIKQGGEEFVIKYYAAYSNTNKILKYEEKQRLHDAGLKIIVIYQGMGNAPEYFSDSLGVENATTALQLAEELNQPEGSAIYFAVDYNVTLEAEINNIIDYFNAIDRTFNGKYKIGIYGNGKICNRIKQELGIAQLSWLSQSNGHSGSPEYDTPGKYNIKQSEYVYYNGVKFDNNVAVGNDYGQW